MLKRDEDSLDGNWDEHRRLVLHQLRTLNESSERHTELLATIKTDIALLHLRASMWGGIAGIGGALAVFVIEWLRRKP